MAFALTHFAALGLLWLLFYATGFLVLRGKCAVEVPALGPSLMRTAVGIVIWIYLLFTLACVRGYRAWIALPLGGAVLLCALVRALLDMRGRWRWPRRANVRPSVNWRRLPGNVARGVTLSAPTVLTLVAVASHTLTGEVGWDDNTYHLTLPKLYIEHGGFRWISFNVYSHWPHNVELLYGLAMMLQDFVLAKLMHGFFLGLTVLAVFRIVRHHASRAAAFTACIMLLGNEVLLFEADRAYIDIAFAFFFLLAIACADEHVRSSRMAPLWMAGISCGALAGTKLSGIAGLGCVGLYVLVQRPYRFSPKRWLVLGMALGVPTLVLAVPWYVKSYLYTGNPFYPFLFKYFGGIEWNAKLGREFYKWQHEMGRGRKLYDYLALPYRVALEGGEPYDHFGAKISGFWALVVPWAMLVVRWARPARSYMLCAWLYFASWAFASQQMRFMIAALPPFAIATALGIDWIVEEIRTQAARVWLRAGLYFGMCFVTLPTLAQVLDDGWSVAKTLNEKGVPDFTVHVPEGYAWVNRNTPKNAKLMLLNVNHGFFLERAYIADSFFEASQMNAIMQRVKTEERFLATLKDIGINYIYVSNDGWGIPYPAMLEEFLHNAHLTKLVYRCHNRSCRVYKIRDR